jgi:hypothetical protein
VEKVGILEKDREEQGAAQAEKGSNLILSSHHPTFQKTGRSLDQNKNQKDETHSILISGRTWAAPGFRIPPESPAVTAPQTAGTPMITMAKAFRLAGLPI